MPKIEECFHLIFFRLVRVRSLKLFDASNFEIILAADAKWWKRLVAASKIGL
jgi:hypothetical protein